MRTEKIWDYTTWSIMAQKTTKLKFCRHKNLFVIFELCHVSESWYYFDSIFWWKKKSCSIYGTCPNFSLWLWLQMRGELMLPNFQFEIGPFWDSNHENVHCIFLTFLENKRFFARTIFTSDYLSTLKLSMDKNEGHRFLNSWCSIFPDRCSLSLEVIFLALLPTWGENLLCLLKKAQQWEQQKSLFFLNSTFYRSAWAWRVFMIFNNSSGRKL